MTADEPMARASDPINRAMRHHEPANERNERAQAARLVRAWRVVDALVPMDHRKTALPQIVAA
jgi:hypothetical protein